PDVACDVTNRGGRVAAIGETLRGDRQDALASVVLLAMPQRRLRHGAASEVNERSFSPKASARRPAAQVRNGLRWEHTGKGCAWRVRAEAMGSGERSAYQSEHDPRGIPVASRGSGLIRVKPERIGLGPGVAVGLSPADEIGPCIVHPSCRLTAL